MLISRAALAQYLDRELDSFTWMKRLRRSELERELAQFRVPPKFKTEPWLHQLVCFYIGLCQPRFLFLLDMGLGKSKILTDLIVQRQRERKLRHALITVPNVINMASWRDDLGKHSDMEPWTCDVENIEEKWERLSNPRGDVTVIDYQGLQWALCDKQGRKLVLNPDRLHHVQDTYNFLGIDESHKLKNHQNLWFQFMSGLSGTMDYVYATTGTIFDKNPEEMWSQFHLVDGGETFGENLGLFRSAFFGQHSDNFKGTVWTFNKRTTKDLNRMMQHRSIRYDEEEIPEIDLPKKVPIVTKLDMGEEQRQHYLHALEGLINAQGRPRDLEAPWVRMRQILSGYLVWKDAHGEHKVLFRDNPKLAEVERIVTEAGSKAKVVVCHYYTETGAMIVDHLRQKMGLDVEWLYGSTKDKQRTRQRFMSDPRCRVLVMNTDTGGTGNDGLQDVANYMVFYESPTPPGTRKQVEKRLHRPGQRHRTFIYDLVMRRTVDQGILDSIKEGTDLFDSVVNGRKIKRELFLVT